MPLSAAAKHQSDQSRAIIPKTARRFVVNERLMAFMSVRAFAWILDKRWIFEVALKPSARLASEPKLKGRNSNNCTQAESSLL